MKYKPSEVNYANQLGGSISIISSCLASKRNKDVCQPVSIPTAPGHESWYDSDDHKKSWLNTIEICTFIGLEEHYSLGQMTSLTLEDLRRHGYNDKSMAKVMEKSWSLFKRNEDSPSVCGLTSPIFFLCSCHSCCCSSKQMLLCGPCWNKGLCDDPITLHRTAVITVVI